MIIDNVAGFCFETEFMGTVMIVNETIFIEEDARVAQIYFHSCEEVKELYNGQWQVPYRCLCLFLLW